MMLDDGFYTYLYPKGDYRTIRVRTPKEGPMVGRHILSLQGEGGEYRWTGVAFLYEAATESGIRCQFWHKFRSVNNEDRLRRIQHVVGRIMGDPVKAGEAYAMKAERCCKCDHKITNPSSIWHGMGPECAGRASGRWTKKDNAKVYEEALGITEQDIRGDVA